MNRVAKSYLQPLLLSKAKIRKEISLLEIPNRDIRDEKTLLQLEEFNHKIILGFIPIKLEPDITPFLIDRYRSGIVIGLPSIIGNEIIFKVYNNQLKLGKFGLLEPDTDQVVDLTQSDILCLAPLVACTSNGERLGRGSGCYDRFFAKHQHIFKVGICYKEQVLDYIPTESHDIKLNRIIYF